MHIPFKASIKLFFSNCRPLCRRVAPFILIKATITRRTGGGAAPRARRGPFSTTPNTPNTPKNTQKHAFSVYSSLFLFFCVCSLLNNFVPHVERMSHTTSNLVGHVRDIIGLLETVAQAVPGGEAHWTKTSDARAERAPGALMPPTDSWVGTLGAQPRRRRTGHVPPARVRS